jgi:hypothetical protein
MIEPTRYLPPLAPTAPLGALERAAWVLSIVAAWMLMHLYAGLSQEAILSTMQALGRVRPDLWAQDIALRFGLQDHHTLFTPLYGLLISAVGPEHAAQLLTVGAQIAFFTVAWRLARGLLTPRQALAGLLLLVALPGLYGAGESLRIAEDFVTPRLLAESLVLAAIICWMHRGRLGTGIFTLLALGFDPLIGITGVALFLWLYLALPRPRLSLVLAGIALALLVLVGWLAKGPPLHFDLAWYQWVPEHLPPLQVARWSAADWGVMLAPLGVLCAGIALLEAPARALTQAALGIALAGIALTAIGADQLHLVLITQAQPWRCLWLSTALATLLAPLIATRLWQHSVLGRACTLLLLAQYLVMGEHYGPSIAALSFAVLALTLLAAPRIPPQYQRLALLGALLVFVLALVVAIANYFVVAHYRYFPEQLFSGPVWLKSLREAARHGLASFLLLGLVAGLTAGAWRRAAAPVLLLLAALGCAVLAPPSWTLWSRVTYTDADKSLFANWRALIPPGNEVLFAENPLFVWIVLERPSYISRAQLSGALFSRPAALVLAERETALRPYLRAQGLNFWGADPGAVRDIPTLEMACATRDLQFIVSSAPLHSPPIATAPAGISAEFQGFKLYQCPGPQG